MDGVEYNKMLVFVYGTLKRKNSRSAIIDSYGGKFIKEAVLPDYTLYDVGPFPAAVPAKGLKIRGEVFQVPIQLVPTLDMIEGHPNLYRRTPVILEDGSPVDCYIWQPSTEGLKPIGEVW